MKTPHAHRLAEMLEEEHPQPGARAQGVHVEARLAVACNVDQQQTQIGNVLTIVQVSPDGVLQECRVVRGQLDQRLQTQRDCSIYRCSMCPS